MKAFIVSILLLVVGIVPIKVESRVLTAGVAQSEIPIYKNASLPKSFEIVGKVMVTGMRSEDLHDEMIKKARMYNGDAVIQYQIELSGTAAGTDVDILQSGTQTTKVIRAGDSKKSTATGIIIRFVDHGGVMSVDASSIIPILK